MRLFFAGGDTFAVAKHHDPVLKAAGVINRLQSFYALAMSAKTEQPPSDFPRLLLDSGGFVARKSGIEIKVEALASYVNRHRIARVFNLDTLDPEETEANLAHLLRACSATTVLPVWHAADWPHNKAQMKRLVDEHPYIGIGALVGGATTKARKQAALDWVFRTFRASVPFHGLGVTSTAWLQRYPWYSADSTSWLSAALYGSRDRGPLGRFENSQHWTRRATSEIDRFIALEEQTTRLWRERGIDWSEVDL